MDKIRKWFNKPKKVDRGLISQMRTDGSDPDLILTTRLSMLRELLQGHVSQDKVVADVQPQHDCPTTENSAASVWTSLLQVGQLGQMGQVGQMTGKGMQVDTGSCDIISLRSVGGGASDSSPGLLKTRDGCSLPSSPCLGGTRRTRLPCSLPCSPLLGGRCWKSPSSSPCPPSGLSRIWVEEALQRSKKLRLPPPCPPQVRQEGEEDRRGETEEDSEDKEWTDEDEVVKIVGIRLSDTVIFRPLSSAGTEEEDGDEEDVLSVDTWTSCQLTPCICLRCPSAPPYEADVFSPGHILSGSEDQQHREGQTQLSHGTEYIQKTEGDSEQTLPRDGAPQLGDDSHLYPSLSLWTNAPDTQTELNRKQEVNTVHSCFHGNGSDRHLQRLRDIIAGVPDEQRTLCPADWSFMLKKVFDSTTCSQRTAACPDESCSVCSHKVTIKRLCTTCQQVFCGHCLCHFLSLRRIHQLSEAAAD